MEWECVCVCACVCVYLCVLCVCCARAAVHRTESTSSLVDQQLQSLQVAGQICSWCKMRQMCTCGRVGHMWAISVPSAKSRAFKAYKLLANSMAPSPSTCNAIASDPRIQGVQVVGQLNGTQSQHLQRNCIRPQHTVAHGHWHPTICLTVYQSVCRICLSCSGWLREGRRHHTHG